MSAYLVVRSVVSEPGDRTAFDAWYEGDHMPKALEILGAIEGWRFWSETDPSLHYAVYRYASLDKLHHRNDAGRRALMSEYERTWPRVTRTREVLRMAGRTAD